MSGRAVRVAVFIDWQNVYLAAREAFRLEALPGERGNFSPFRLGCLLAAANGRGAEGKLVRVEIHRGLPVTQARPILFSHDNDLLPVPGAIARLAGPDRIETASWLSPCFRRRLRPEDPIMHHSITQKVFKAVETPINYSRATR